MTVATSAVPYPVIADTADGPQNLLPVFLGARNCIALIVVPTVSKNLAAVAATSSELPLDGSSIAQMDVYCKWVVFMLRPSCRF